METTNNKIYAPALWPYRLLGNLLLIGGIWLITFGVITIRHNLVSKHIDSLMTELYNKTATVGWGLDDVTLEGRSKTSKDDVLRVIGLKRGDNILEIDLNAVCEKVKTLPWVRALAAAIFQTLFISASEKKKLNLFGNIKMNFILLMKMVRLLKPNMCCKKIFCRL